MDTYNGLFAKEMPNIVFAIDEAENNVKIQKKERDVLPAWKKTCKRRIIDEDIFIEQ